jgi:hypothetical protein
MGEVPLHSATFIVKGLNHGSFQKSSFWKSIPSMDPFESQLLVDL